MYGNDTNNIGMNISAGATGGVSTIAITQDILLSLICVFAILSVITVFKVVHYARLKTSPVPVPIDNRTPRG